jgi:beta-1,4-N-acetylglucosaminyltransferase
MILVTVGTHVQGFDRLVKPMDELAKQINEKVLIQYGTSNYQPKYTDSFQWANSQQMEKYTLDAHIVITHAAAGAIILALKQKKGLFLFPD